VGTGVYFMTYESLKQFLTSYRKDTSPTNPFAVLFAGGLCGVASWALIYPIDSAKSIYQKNCLLSHQGGIRKKAPKIEFFNKRMYRGLGVSMGRSALVNSIFFSSFEFIKKEINALDWTQRASLKPEGLSQFSLHPAYRMAMEVCVSRNIQNKAEPI